MFKLGWMLLFLSQLVSVLFAIMLTAAPTAVMQLEAFAAPEVQGVIRAWGVTWVLLSILLFVALFTGFQKGDRWAWNVLWMTPLLWFSHFALAPDTVHNLALGVVSALALVLTAKRFSPDQNSLLSAP